MPSTKTITHRINKAGDCSCGQDGVTCQGCGKRICGELAVSFPKKGNFCLKCVPASRKEPVVSMDEAAIRERAELEFMPEGEQGSDPTPARSAPVVLVGTTATVALSSPVPTSGRSTLTGVLAGAGKVRVNPPHVVVIARAGTGKTTTLVEGLKALKGLPTSIDPSPQQRAVWDAILLSKDRCKSVCFAAFNKTIAEELKARVPAGCEASTLHSLGFRSVRKRYGNVEVSEKRVKGIVLRLLKMDEQTLRDDDPLLLSRVEQLVSLCKVNLLTGTTADLNGLCDRYDVEFGDLDGTNEAYDAADALRERVFALVPKVLAECRKVEVDHCIDYDDMIWIPVVNELPCWRNDLLLVDEAQDMNRCQQAMAMKCGDRLVLCGDDKQAIYGFAGADSESIPNMIQRLKGDRRGCDVLPLTVTRRCGRAIVKEANKYVPDFSAHESNGEGEVKTAEYPKGKGSKAQVEDDKTYLALVRPGDMIVSRANAPLVIQCFKILKRGIPAFIVGKADVAKSLTSLITKMDATTVPELVRKLEAWAVREIEKEEAKKEPNGSKVERVRDRRDCALAFCEDMESVKDVLRRVDRLFEVVQDAVRLSSVHRAKGLESTRVFFIAPGGFRPRHARTQEWEWQQELNLRYVAVTRAIHTLIYVF